MASMQLAMVGSAIVAFLLSNPTFLFGIVEFIPDDYRLPVAILIAMFIFALVASTRLLKKVPKDTANGQPTDDQQTADC